MAVSFIYFSIFESLTKFPKTVTFVVLIYLTNILYTSYTMGGCGRICMNGAEYHFIYYKFCDFAYHFFNKVLLSIY